MKKKSSTTQIIKDFIAEIELQYSSTPKGFRTDNGGEYVSTELKDYLRQKGIVHQFTPPYSPESNGMADRLNRTTGESLRAMLESAPTYDKRLWAEAVSTSVYLKNRQPHMAVKDQTPNEAFHGNKPSISHLKPFGSECYIHIPKQQRLAGMKIQPRVQRAILTGYANDDHHYRVHLPESKHTLITNDIFFPPSKIEGDSTYDKSSYNKLKSIPRTSIEHRSDNEKFPSDDMWLAWMERNPSEARKMFDQGNQDVMRLVIEQYDKGQRSGFLGPDYWTFEIDEDQESIHTPQRQSHFFTEHLNEDSTQPPPSPPQEQYNHQLHGGGNSTNQQQQQLQVTDVAQQHPTTGVTTQAGRQVRPPRKWWRAETQNEQIFDRTMRDADEISLSLDSEESLLTSILIDEPQSYSKAKSSPNWSDWKIAINEELQSLKDNDVWEEVTKPTNRKIVDSRWVFKIKTDAKGEIEQYIARLAAKGYSQLHGPDYDDMFSSVVRYDSLRLLLAIAACKGWKPHQLDVKTAFLYGILKEEIYMHLPEGSRIDGKVAKLKRCIYGLKQSPREWYYRLVEYLIPYGFVITAFDPCVLVHNSGDLFLTIYVDDITMYGETVALKDQTIGILKTVFKVNDMGTLHWLLGINITFTDAGITLSQTAFIEKILNRFGLQSCKSVSTPIDPNHRLTKNLEQTDDKTTKAYQQIIGSLMYLVTGTRPDLAYSITHLSQFNTNPSNEHMATAKRVLRYLQGTKEFALFYP